jgi:hypothetical protein
MVKNALLFFANDDGETQGPVVIASAAKQSIFRNEAIGVAASPNTSGGAKDGLLRSARNDADFGENVDNAHI